MLLSALDRKLLRDLWHMRGQVITVALIVASGIATYVTMRGAYESVERAQQQHYASYHFADVFAQLKRAPNSLAAEIGAIPGVSVVETRVVVEVNLDVPGLDEPAVGRLVSIPERKQTMLNDLFLRSGRYLEPGRQDEVLVSEAFSSANHLEVGTSISAVINGRWERLRIVGVALSPEYVYEIRGAEVFPDNKRFGVLWLSREALGPLFNMEGGFNDVSIALAPGASEAGVLEQTDKLLEPYGGLGAYGRDDQVSHRFLTDEIAQDRITGIFVPSIFLGIAAFLIHVVLSRGQHAEKSSRFVEGIWVFRHRRGRSLSEVCSCRGNVRNRNGFAAWNLARQRASPHISEFLPVPRTEFYGWAEVNCLGHRDQRHGRLFRSALLPSHCCCTAACGSDASGIPTTIQARNCRTLWICQGSVHFHANDPPEPGTQAVESDPHRGRNVFRSGDSDHRFLFL